MQSRTKIEDVSVETDRREEPRSVSDEPTVIWTTLDRPLEGRIIDRSPVGLGVTVPCNDINQFRLGYQVLAEIEGRKRIAWIVDAAETSDGRCRLGLRLDTAID